MKKLYALLLITTVVLLYSCATMISGSTQKISFESTPAGADIYVNGEFTGKTTPAELHLKRKVKRGAENDRNQYVYNFKRDGYEDVKIFDDSELNNIIWLNLILLSTAPIGIPIDFISGSANKYDSKVNVALNKKNTKTDTVIKKEIVYVNSGPAKQSYVFEKKSDVDTNIPVTPYKFDMRFALIIGNEDYSSHQTDLVSEVNVDFARNDASAFKEYAIQVLGIPQQNIIFLLDATTGQMNQAISKANRIIKNTNGNAEFFIYYAGHGLPDENTKEPYLIPVDVSGKNITDGISLKSMYSRLTEFQSKRITVFIDACFTGGARNQGLYAARGVKMTPKEEVVNNNIIVFNASSGQQSSLPFAEQNHGFFTYYLLKKLKETGGNLTYQQLAKYISDNVSLRSVLINDKEQNPKVNVSADIIDKWEDWRVNE